MHRITVGVTLFIVFAGLAVAMPEYQMEYQQTCALCHHNPNGGGMRTLYGAQFFSYNDLPANPLGFEELENVKPQLNENIHFGMDMRGLFYMQDNFSDAVPADATAGDDNRFVLMQANLYTAVHLSERAMVHVEVNRSGVRETWGLFRGLPMDGVVRVGKFMPSYGWRFADHKLFVRRFLGYGGTQGAGPNAYDTGIEVGFYPQSWDITLGVVNGNPASDGRSTLLRIGKRLTLGSLNCTLGGSYRLWDWSHAETSDQVYGLHYGVNWGRWTWLGESDVLDETVSGYVTTQQLRYRVKKGLYLNGYYEFFDPDLDIAAGAYQRIRMAADIIPRGYMSITPAFEWNIDANDDEYGIGEIQLHLWL